MNDASQRIVTDFAEYQEARITTLLGKIIGLETLIDMLWTNELAKTDDPQFEAEELKETILNDLVIYDPDDPVEEQAFDALETRLDSIAHRVRSRD